MTNLTRDLPGWTSTREHRVMWLLDEKKLSRRRIAESLSLSYGQVCRIVRKFRGNRFAYRQGAAPKVMGAAWPDGIRPFAELDAKGQQKRQWLLERTHQERDHEGLTLEEAQAKHPKDGKRLIAYLWGLPHGYQLQANEIVPEATEQGQLWDGKGLDPRGEIPENGLTVPFKPSPRVSLKDVDLSEGPPSLTSIQVNGDTIRIPHGATVRIQQGDMTIEVQA